MRISNPGPAVTHLMFADDSLLFCKAEVDQVKCIKEILSKYEAASGQKINLVKSSVLFSKNATPQCRTDICEILQGVTEQCNSNYLGLPLVIGRSRKQVFKFIQERISKKMENWKSKLLSEAGKEVMLKSVIQALPVYSMSCFKLPKGVCSEISKSMARFWWSKNGQARKIHWMNWESLTDAKDQGGLGFKDLEAFNLALLGKQIWRLITKPNLLMSKVMKSKYFPKSDLFQVPLRPRDSLIWKSWKDATSLIKEGSRWAVGTGNNIRVWEDNWLMRGQWKKPFSPKPEGCRVQKVKDLLHHEKEGWNEELIRDIFCEEEVQNILAVPVSSMGTRDRLIWSSSSNGHYSVASGYKLARVKSKQDGGDVGPSCKREEVEKTLWNKVWSLNIKRKIQHFLWKACHNRIPVAVNLKKRGVQVDEICRQCGEAAESTEHLFLHCPRTQLIWKLSPVRWEGPQFHASSLKDWWTKISAAKNSLAIQDGQEFTSYLLWHIWKDRNGWLFNGERKTEAEIVQRAWEEWWEFKGAQKKGQSRAEGRVNVVEPQPWKPPAPGMVKINVSSICDQNCCNVGVGVLARDESGSCVNAWAVARDRVCNPVVAEVYAVRAALLMALHNGWQRIEIQVDIKALADSLQAQAIPVVEATAIAEDIFLLQLMFESCNYSFVHKRFNRAVSLLACFAQETKQNKGWRISLPVWLQQAAIEDLGPIG